MSIFCKELKNGRVSLLLWSLGTLFMILMGAMKFALTYQGRADINEIMRALPPVFSILIGLGNNIDLSSGLGFFCMMAPFSLYIGVFHAALTGVSSISREEQLKTSEFLYSKPVPRNYVLRLKLCAVFAQCLVFNLCVTGAYLLSFNPVSEQSLTVPILQSSAALLMLQIIFLCAGAAIASISSNPGAAGRQTLAFTFYCLLLAKLIPFSSSLYPLRFLTPIKYFDMENILYGSGFDPVYWLLTALLVGLFLYTVFTKYRTRDLRG